MKGGDDALSSDMESDVVLFTDLIQQSPGRALEFWQGDPINFREEAYAKTSELLRCGAEPRTDCPSTAGLSQTRSSDGERPEAVCLEHDQHETEPSRGEA